MTPPNTIPLAPPAGMRDLLPAEAALRSHLAGQLTRLFASFGYEYVVTPAFEHAAVIERGLGPHDRGDLLRFVEPETGEVALLRPDITPQIARMIATQLSDRPAPFRLSYAGSLIRQRRGRARRPRQIYQAGVECVGLPGRVAEVEVIALATIALERVGLQDFRIELHLPELLRSEIQALPDAIQASATHALGQKDQTTLRHVLDHSEVDADQRKRLLGTLDLYGDVSVLNKARKLFRKSKPLRELEKLTRDLEAQGLAERLCVDLAQVRGASYYSGVSFAILAAGPGEPVGGGGRYDDLMARFAFPSAAIGFGIDVGNLAWALEHAEVTIHRPSAIRVVLGGPRDACDKLAPKLRKNGVHVALLNSRGRSTVQRYAEAWNYDAALVLQPSGIRAWRRSDGATREFRRGIGAFMRWVTPTEGS